MKTKFVSTELGVADASLRSETFEGTPDGSDSFSEA